MASNSKKRRRVLRVSCILAALIIAGSSFAWFTSKDEVINRLSANADYGVSIVESFAPPENWLPGQEVNKDVYAVNTGNVAAFVEETVSGKLTITTEVAKDAISANSVKLTAAERYAVEAGSYLAYKPATSNKELGVQVVSMIPDATNLEGYTTADAATDFTPDAAGLYVFRRSIGVDANTKVETFKYEAYYFDGHDYYKVTDLSVTPDGASYAGDNVTTDGNLTGATAKFVEEETKTINPTALTYDSDNNRLVASYDTGAEITSTKLQELAKAYDDALIAYQDALEEYNAAVRDNTTANGNVSTENGRLQTAIANLLNGEKTLQEKLDALTAATNAKNAAQADLTAAQNAVDDAKRTLYGYKDGGTTNKADDRTEGTDSENYYKSTSVYGKYVAAKDADDAAQAEVAAAQTALGSLIDLANNAVGASAYAKYNFADEAVMNATSDDRDAYIAYLVSANAITNASEADTYLAGVNYETLLGLNISNSSNAYNYHQLVVALKAAEKDLADAQANLADKQADKAVTAQKLIDAETAKTNAETALTNAQNDLGTSSDLAPTDDTAYGRYKKADNDVTTAQGGFDDAMRSLYGYKDGGRTTENDTATEGTNSTGCYKTTSLYGKFKKAEKDYNDAVTAATGNPSASTRLTAAQNNLAKATQTLNETQAAYNNAGTASDGKLKININLSDAVTTDGDVADKWQLLPDPVNGGTAYFYYTSILGAGQTSAQLIDSVELDSSVTDDMFKRFDFDLNVALKSVQIAKDADGKITTDATTELDANATLVTPTSVDSVVNWTLK